MDFMEDYNKSYIFIISVIFFVHFIKLRLWKTRLLTGNLAFHKVNYIQRMVRYSFQVCDGIYEDYTVFG